MANGISIAFAPLEPRNPGKAFPQSGLVVFNSLMWPKLDQDTRDFVAAHEAAHIDGATREVDADLAALQMLAMKKQPKTLYPYISSARVFLDENKPEHRRRLEALTRAALIYDVEKNQNPEAVKLLEKIEQSHNFLEPISAALGIVGTGISVFSKIFGGAPDQPRDQWDTLSNSQKQKYAKLYVDYAFSGKFDNPREVLWDGDGGNFGGLSAIATDTTSLKAMMLRDVYLQQLVLEAEVTFEVRKAEYKQNAKLKTALIWGGGAVGVLLFILFIIWLVKS